MQEKNIDKEKVLANKLMRETIVLLNKDFPWTVIEIAMSLNIRIGEDKPFVIQMLDGILDAHAKEQIVNYNPECDDNGLLTTDVALDMYNKFDTKGFSQIFNKPLFSLDTQAKEECSPWDLAEETTSYDILGNEKVIAIKNIKMKLRELAMLRGILGRQENLEENIAIDTIFEVLNFDIV